MKQASLIQASQASSSSTSSPLTPPPTRSPTPTGSFTSRPSRIPIRVASPLSPPSTPSPHITAPKQPYLTVDDLHKMFAGKPRLAGLQQHQVPVPGTRQLPPSRDTAVYVARIRQLPLSRDTRSKRRSHNRGSYIQVAGPPIILFLRVRQSLESLLETSPANFPHPQLSR